MNMPTIPQELQDMVIDGNEENFLTLLQASQVNHAWRDRTFHKLFSTLVVRSTACRPQLLTVTANGQVEYQHIAQIDDPTLTFDKALPTIPASLASEVTTLVLCGTTITQRVKYAARGIELVKPDLSACTVRAYLDRYPRVRNLVIEDVNWADCTRVSQHCDCMNTIPKREYSTMVLRGISHNGVGMNATYLMQSASSIKHFIVEGVQYVESNRPPYPVVSVSSYTLGLFNSPWGFFLPDLGEAQLRTLTITGMTTADILDVQDLITTHHTTLQHFAIKVWSLGNGKLRFVVVNFANDLVRCRPVGTAGASAVFTFNHRRRPFLCQLRTYAPRHSATAICYRRRRATAINTSHPHPPIRPYVFSHRQIQLSSLPSHVGCYCHPCPFVAGFPACSIGDDVALFHRAA